MPTNFVSAAPFPAGNHYRVEWNYNNGQTYCVDDHQSAGRVVRNSVDLGGVCDTAQANNRMYDGWRVTSCDYSL